MTTTPAPELTATTTWNIDPVHSTAQFKVKHLMISNVKGEFTAITGKLEFSSADVTKSRVEASIDAKTINTREAQRDAHLRSAEFFDVESYRASVERRHNSRGEQVTVTEATSLFPSVRFVAPEIARAYFGLPSEFLV